MIKKTKKTLYMFYKAGDNLLTHDGVELAGYLSFLTMLAFFPFLVFLFAILGAIGETELGTRYIAIVVENAPPNVLNAILPRIHEIVSGPPMTLLTVAILGALWTASSIVEGVRTVLNRAYHVVTPPSYYWRRTLSILQMLVLTVILIVAMMALVFAPIVMNKIAGIFITFNSATYLTGETQQVFPFIKAQWEIIGKLMAAAVMLFFVSALYYTLPNVKQRWRRTLPGALIVVLGWLIVARVYGYYLMNFNQMNIIYGSLANIIAFLVFFYIQNIVFIYGAEFNYLLERSLGHKIEQKEQVALEEQSVAGSNEVELTPKKKIRKKTAGKKKRGKKQ